MTREEIIQLNTDYLNGCEREHKMNELFEYVLELKKQERLEIGHWIVEKINNPSGEKISYITSYCPHCGKKMEGEIEQESVLDKIRTEIEQLPSELTTDGRRMIRRGSAFRVIDKYKNTESEK